MEYQNLKKQKYIHHQEEPLQFDDHEFLSKIKYLVDITLEDQEENNLYNTKVALTSKGQKLEDFSVYTGTGGNAYLYYRLYCLAKKVKSGLTSTYLNFSLEAFKISKMRIKENRKKEKVQEIPTFYCGEPGVYLIGALIYFELKDNEEFAECVEEIMSLGRLFKPDSKIALDNELLYGRAGYLYCLLTLRKKFTEQLCDKLDPIISSVVDSLIQDGTNEFVEYLYYTFPKGGSQYLGAAHGTIGIVYMLINSIEVLPELIDNQDFVGKIKSTLAMIMIQQSKDGNFPYLIDEILNENEMSNHWCHGAPGAIPLFTQAYKVFKDKQYLDVAIKCGNCVWKKGLLKKGFGLCHGICGNAYMLLALYKCTGDLLWKQRAQSFLLWTGDDEIVKAVKSYEYGNLKVQGIPDTPYSLMEGQGGQIVAYADFLGLDEKQGHELIDIKFPGYEI